jgi:dTDP-4-dehydrorhamnose 3,5-epimerase-like enzyme
MMIPTIIQGGSHTDERGILSFNNAFDASVVKRVYTIQNKDCNCIRGWRGHRIEQRWFSSVNGSFRIELIAVDDWDNPPTEVAKLSFTIDDKKLDILHIPPGYLSSIQAITTGATLLVMADYKLGEVKDEYRFDIDYFTSEL